MGEFGFITADGVYHLTVYATDENGNFKILKMKNTYIGLRKYKKKIFIPSSNFYFLVQLERRNIVIVSNFE